jgi:Holliday junction resolvase
VRRLARVDDNQKEIADALRVRGCSVVSLAAMGAGCPDLLVGRHGFNFLLEVKNSALPPSGQKLTKEQWEFHGRWRGQAVVVNSVEQALEAVGF